MSKPTIKRHYCMDCGHTAREHNLAMNTCQDGRCRVEGCNRCIHYESPTRDDLFDRIEELEAMCNIQN